MWCNKCGNNKKCGCKDRPLVTQAGCSPNAECPNPEECSETISTACSVYTGDSLIELGIIKGERLDIILQRLGLFILNPGCITPGSGCQSALGVKTYYIGPTSAKVQWQAVPGATSYQLEYKTAAATSWVLSPAVAVILDQETYTDAIGGLLPNTEYYVRINTTCSSGGCYSLIISFTTLTQ
jgi:hypothetical protein